MVTKQSVAAHDAEKKYLPKDLKTSARPPRFLSRAA
jgi:hypothetical protein